MGINNSGNAGIAGTLVSFLVDGHGTQLPFNFTVSEFTGGVSFPTINRRGRGEGATAAATVGGGAVSGTSGLTGGFGYIAASVSLTGGGGTGGSVTATITGGVVTSLTVAAGGTGYTSAPTLTITESSGETPRTKLGDVNGSGILKFTMQNTGTPIPDLPKYATGVVRQIMQTEGYPSPQTPVDYFDFPARFENIGWDHNDPKSNTWAGSATWTLAGNPTATWRGTQVTISVPSTNDVSTYEGMSKTYDSNLLQSVATGRIDCETIGNSSTAEVAKLVSAWSTLTAPMPSLKLVTLSLVRTDSNGVALQSSWAYNDTKDNVQYPRISTTEDAENIEDAAIRAQVWYNSGSAPALPTDAPTNNVKLVTYADFPLNPLANVRVWYYAELNSRDKVVQPNYETTADTNSLASTAIRACLDGESISDPAGYTLRTTKTVPLTFALGVNRTLTVKVYGLRDTKDDIEMPGTSAIADELEIDSSAKAAQVYTTLSGPSASPAPPLDELQLVSTEQVQLNRVKSVQNSVYDVLNSEEKRTYPKTSTTDDANNIDDEAMRAQFWDTGFTPPATPSDAPANNVKLIKFVDVPITPTKQLRVWLYGERNTRDEEVLKNYNTVADASNLESIAVRACLDTESISDPAGYVLRLTKTYPLSFSLGTNRTVTVKVYGLRTTKADIENPGTYANLDPLAIDSNGKDTDVYLTSSGVPAAPSLPSAELQIVNNKIEVINTLMSQRTVEFDTLTSEQKRTYPKISTTDDAQNINDEAMRSEFWNVGDSPPATPSDVPANNVKLVEFADFPVTPAKNIRVWRYGERNSRDDVVLKHYETTADASNLESEAMRACLDGESISDPSGYTLRLTKTFPLSFSLGVNRTLTVKIYGLRTTKADIENPNTSTEIDPDAIETHGKKTTVYLTSGGVPADPTPPTNTQIVASRIEVINDLESQKEWIFRANKSGQEIVNAETISTRSPIDAWTDVVVSIIDDASDCSVIADAQWAVFKSDPSLVKLAVKRITPAKVKVVYFYADSGITVAGETYGAPRVVPARLNSGTLEVYASQVIDIDGTNSWVLHKSRQLRSRAIRKFRVIQTLSGSTIPDQESIVGQVNSDTFLGITAGKVLYMGAEYKTRYDVSGTRVFEMTYWFYEDSNGIFDYDGIADEWFVTSAAVSAGWVSASTFNPDIVVTAPTSTAFTSVFL